MVSATRDWACRRAVRSEGPLATLSMSRGLSLKQAPSRLPRTLRVGCKNSLSSVPCHGGTLAGSPLMWRRGTLQKERKKDGSLSH